MPRVLVIDDDPTIRQVIAFALADEGYQVAEAAEGRAALALVEIYHPDVILLDMKMPGVDGWEFVRLFRERYGHEPPVIVVSAANDAARRAAEVKAGSYLAKPFDLEVLVQRVAAFAKARNSDVPNPPPVPGSA